jgi:hypothetical protein
VLETDSTYCICIKVTKKKDKWRWVDVDIESASPAQIVHCLGIAGLVEKC